MDRPGGGSYSWTGQVSAPTSFPGLEARYSTGNVSGPDYKSADHGMFPMSQQAGHRAIMTHSDIPGTGPRRISQSQTVLLVQPDGLIEANITEQDVDGGISHRRESRDYFEGVVGLNDQGTAVYAQAANALPYTVSAVQGNKSSTMLSGSQISAEIELPFRRISITEPSMMGDAYGTSSSVIDITSYSPTMRSDYRQSPSQYHASKSSQTMGHSLQTSPLNSNYAAPAHQKRPSYNAVSSEGLQQVTQMHHHQASLPHPQSQPESSLPLQLRSLESAAMDRKPSIPIFRQPFLPSDMDQLRSSLSNASSRSTNFSMGHGANMGMSVEMQIDKERHGSTSTATTSSNVSRNNSEVWQRNSPTQGMGAMQQQQQHQIQGKKSFVGNFIREEEDGNGMSAGGNGYQRW